MVHWWRCIQARKTRLQPPMFSPEQSAGTRITTWVSTDVVFLHVSQCLEDAIQYCPSKLVATLSRVAGVTAGLAESNGSLPSGLWLTSPAGWLPRAGISSRTLRSAIECGLPFLSPIISCGLASLTSRLVYLCTDLHKSSWKSGHQTGVCLLLVCLCLCRSCRRRCVFGVVCLCVHKWVLTSMPSLGHLQLACRHL